MRSGKMRESVEFQRLDSTPDDYGNATSGSWSEIVTVRGELLQDRGRERFEAGRLEASDRSILRIRSSVSTRGITTADRAVIGSESYQIRSITNPDRKNHEIQMVLDRGVAT